MREPWFVAPERAYARGARMSVHGVGHFVGCLCSWCRADEIDRLAEQNTPEGGGNA